MSDNVFLFPKNKNLTKNKQKSTPNDKNDTKEIDMILNMSDEMDDVVKHYLDNGVTFQAVAAVMANRLGTLLSAGKKTNAPDITDLCIDVVIRESSRED